MGQNPAFSAKGLLHVLQNLGAGGCEVTGVVGIGGCATVTEILVTVGWGLTTGLPQPGQKLESDASCLPQWPQNADGGVGEEVTGETGCAIGWGGAIGATEVAIGAIVVVTAAGTGDPQLPQNRCPGTRSLPQLVQCIGRFNLSRRD